MAKKQAKKAKSVKTKPVEFEYVTRLTVRVSGPITKTAIRELLISTAPTLTESTNLQ